MTVIGSFFLYSLFKVVSVVFLRGVADVELVAGEGYEL